MISPRIFFAVVLALCIQSVVQAKPPVVLVQNTNLKDDTSCKIMDYNVNEDMMLIQEAEGFAGLFDIARNGSLSCVRKTLNFLFDNDELAVIEDVNGVSFFMHAASGNGPEVISAIIAYSDERTNSPIDDATDTGWTALMYAARDNTLAVVKTLLANGADSRLRNNEGKTAAQLASSADIANYINGQEFATVTITSTPPDILVQVSEFDITGWTPLTIEVPLNREFSISADEQKGYVGIAWLGHKFKDTGPHTLEVELERDLEYVPDGGEVTPGFYTDTVSGSDIYAMLDYAGISDFVDCPPEAYVLFDGTKADDILCINTGGDAVFQKKVASYAQQSTAVSEFFDFEPMGGDETQLASITYNDGYELFIVISLGQAIIFGGD